MFYLLYFQPITLWLKHNRHFIPIRSISAVNAFSAISAINRLTKEPPNTLDYLGIGFLCTVVNIGSDSGISIENRHLPREQIYH